MQVNDRPPVDVQTTSETQDPAELRRIAHKIAWARMNGSIDAANPFVEAAPLRPAPGDGTSGLSHHR
jgi:hypothetical protein